MIWRDNEVNPPDPTGYSCLAYKDNEQFLDEVYAT